MNRVARTLLTAAFALAFAAIAVLARADRPETSFVAPVTTLPTTSTTTTVAPPVIVSTTTTTPPPPPTTTTAAPRPVVTAPATPRPTAVPVVRAPTGRAESCGWAWDATRLDDGSLNEVTISLDAPRRANEALSLIVKPGASLTSTPAISHPTTTDGAGQASSTFSLSNDKRDWTLTVSASFAAGGVCSPQTFTLVY